MIPPDRLQDQRNLDARFAKGLAWTVGAKWATQILTWTSLLAVARLLSPSDYGVGEMAGTLTIVSSVMAEFGIGTAVLHMPELTRKNLAQLNMFSFLVCAGVFALVTAAAPLVASFYHSDHLLLFIVNNTVLLFTGLQSVPAGLLARDMDYRRLSLVEGISVVVHSGVTILTAWLGWGYWALISGNVASRATAAILTVWWKHVGFSWPDWTSIHTPVRLGWQTAVGRTAWSLYTQADAIVVGRILGAPVMGNYRIAMNLASAPAEKVSTLLMRTATPLFANVKDDHALVRRYYIILAEILSLLVMPLMVGLAIVTPLAVPVVFGAQWAPAIAPVRWLALFMIVRTMGTLTEQVLISQRMTRFTMRMSIFNFILMPVAFVAGARWLGLGGVAGAWLALSPLTIVPLVIILLRTIKLPFREFVGALVPALAGSAAMSLAVLALGHWLLPASWSPKTLLAIQVAAGGAVYGAVLLGFFRERVFRYGRFLRAMKGGNKDSATALSPLPVEAE